MTNKKISRREFVTDTSKAAVGAGVLLGAGPALAGAPPPRTRVVKVRSDRAVSKDRKVDAAVVRDMVRRGLKALIGVDEPFKKLFKPTDRVGLKINCLGRRLIHTHPELVDAWAAELQAAGVKADNIIVWDRFEDHMKKCRYPIRPDGPGVRYFGSESRSADTDRYDARAGYIAAGSDTPSRVSTIFTESCDKIVNLAILKDHGLAGVTLTLKNIAFGVCDNNSRFHGRAEIGSFIADFCARPDVRKKFVLHVIDGLEGCFDGGPAPGSADQLFQPRTLWLGTDPVALDRLGADVIEAKRKEAGEPSLQADGRPADHIRLAAERGVGTDDRTRIDVVEVKLG